MSSERASRALLAASDSLGQMAALSWQQEQAKAQAEREENMLRLRQKLSNEELDKRQGFDVANEESRFQHNLKVNEVEAERRGKETAEERKWREQQARTERGWQNADRTRAESLQRENWTRQDRDAIERQAAAQASTIDGRILDIRDAVDKGEYTDPTKAEGEIKRLMAERDRIRTDTIARLADMGDPRYKEVKPPPGSEASQQPRAAQGPMAVDVKPPPKAPSDVRKEQKGDLDAIRRRMKSSTEPGPVHSAPSPGRGAQNRALLSGGDLGAMALTSFAGEDAKRQQKLAAAKEAARAFFAAVTDRKPVPAQVKAALMAVPPEARRQFGVTDDYLRYLE